MPPKRYKDMTPEEKEEFMRRMKANREARMKGRTPEQYQKEQEAKRKELEAKRRERETKREAEPKNETPILKTLTMDKKATKKQQVKQYPPRYTTSKPTPPKPMTSTYKPKLNLQYIQQVNQPATVSPSENTRNVKLTVSSTSSKHIPEQVSYEREKGQIEGLEEDGRIYKSEKDMYISALGKLGRYVHLPQPRHKIRATNDVLNEIDWLPGGNKRFSKRLTSWT